MDAAAGVPTHRRVIALAVPIVLANLTQPLLSAVDTAIAGHLPGPAFLGGVALGGLVFNFIFWGLGFLRMGTTGLIAQAHGAGDALQVRATLLRAFCLALALGVVLILAQGLLFGRGLPLFGASADVLTQAEAYSRARIWSAPLALSNYVLLGYLLGVQRVRSALALQIAINLVNLLAVVALVYGAHAGVAGIGAATALADASGSVLGAALLWRLWPRGLPALARATLFAPSAWSRLLFINASLFIRTICLLATFAWFAHAGALEGDVVLAANALLLNFQTFMAYALDGFAHASEALVGAAIGARHRVALRAAIAITTLWSAGTALAFVALYAACGTSIVAALTDLESVRRSAATYLPYAIVSPIVSVWGFQFDGVFIGATRTQDLMGAMVVSALVFGCAVTFLQPRLGNQGLWLALLLFMASRGLTLAALLPRLVALSLPEPAPGRAATPVR